MTARLGLGSFIGFGYTALYTTDAVAADVDFRLPVEGGFHNLQGETDRMDFQNLDTYDALASLQFAGQKRVSGGVTFRAPWSAIGDILRMITGHNPTIAGGPPVTGTFNLLDPDDTTHILTGTTKRNLFCEIFTNGTDGLSVFYQGLIITQAQITFNENEWVEIALTFLGRGVTRSAKSTTPVLAVDLMKTPNGQAVRLMNIGGADLRANSVTLTIDSPYTHNYDVTDDEATTTPSVDGKRAVSLEADVEAPGTDTEFANLMETLTPQDIILTLSPTGDDQLVITARDCIISPGSEARPEGVNTLRANPSWTAHDDGTNPIVAIQADNNVYIAATLP